MNRPFYQPTDIVKASHIMNTYLLRLPAGLGVIQVTSWPLGVIQVSVRAVGVIQVPCWAPGGHMLVWGSVCYPAWLLVVTCWSMGHSGTLLGSWWSPAGLEVIPCWLLSRGLIPKQCHNFNTRIRSLLPSRSLSSNPLHSPPQAAGQKTSSIETNSTGEVSLYSLLSAGLPGHLCAETIDPLTLCFVFIKKHS